MSKKVFILHGWTYNKDKWNELIEYLSKKNISTVMLSIPGLTEDTEKAWTLDEYVEWLREKLMLDRKPVLIGHSNGGRIALAYAAKYPDSLGKLILIDAAGIYHNHFSIKIKRLVFKKIAKIGKKFTKSEFLRNLLYKATGEKDYKNAPPIMRKTLNNLINVDLTPKLMQITVPTVIIWGKLDKITLVSDAFILKKGIKDSKLFFVNDADHSPHFTHPEYVGKKIIDLL